MGARAVQSHVSSRKAEVIKYDRLVLTCLLCDIEVEGKYHSGIKDTGLWSKLHRCVVEVGCGRAQAQHAAPVAMGTRADPGTAACSPRGSPHRGQWMTLACS